MTALLLASVTAPAWGWGSQGHKIVAMVATDHLTPTARKNVKALLGAETSTGFVSDVIHDASFVKLREVSVRYNLPDNFIAPLHALPPVDVIELSPTTDDVTLREV